MSEETQAFAPLERMELGEGLEIWKVLLADIHEQDVNARAMSQQAFLQLTETIKKTKRLESLPLCVLKDSRIEVVSGHHRTRAARKAQMKEIWILIDVTDMPRDFIVAKQLAHNSIQGEDNPDLLAKLFGEIGDSEARIEAFIETDMAILDTDVRLSSREPDVVFETKIVSLLFQVNCKLNNFIIRFCCRHFFHLSGHFDHATALYTISQQKCNTDSGSQQKNYCPCNG